jgi:hypothetical protein
VRAGRRLAIACGVVLSMLSGGSAQAVELGVVPGSLSIRTLRTGGGPERRAGAHPDRLEIEFALNGDEAGTRLRDLVLNLPPGLSGDPGAAESCPREVFDVAAFGSSCPPGSQVGIADAVMPGLGEQKLQMYNVAPAPGDLASVGFDLIMKFPFVMSLRPTDYGLSLEQRDLAQLLSFTKVRVELWGIPADHQEGTSIPRRPFLTNPTRCGEPLEITLRLRSWRPGAPWSTATSEDGGPLSGCEDLPFEPSLSFDLTEPKADSPTGLQLDLTVPQDEDPDELVQSQVRSATIDLPEGMTISPGVAAGLSACSDEQLRLGSSSQASCPPGSRVGTVEVTGPQLREPLAGVIHVGEERPGDRFRVFAVARGAGVEAKLAGSLRPDPATGRLQAVLSELPQIPFGRLSMRFDGGPQALLAAPLRCGPAAAVASFAPYSGGPRVQANDTVAVEPAGSGQCSGEPSFSPEVVAGTPTARAGRPTSFTMALRRSDGEQPPGRFSVRFPPGLNASVGGVERCGGGASGRCPAAARIGSAVAEVGSGPSPAVLNGDVFLTGPYRGAPFGLATVFPAALGPFDLGTVVVRSALRLDPLSGRVTVETDSLPTSIEGLPVRFGALALTIDRPGLIGSPTSCEPTAVGVTVRSTAGQTAERNVPFAVRGCNTLGFRPRLSLALTGHPRPRRGEKPGLRIAARSRRGDTNLRRVDILLPDALAFDASGLRAVCSLRDASRGQCPRSSRVGSALARTGLLDEPLTGSIHVVQPPGTGLPDLWTILEGKGIRLFVRGRVTVEDGRPRAQFVDLPDVPLESLVMRLAGGERGILSFASSPCSASARQRRSAVLLEGHDRAVRLDRVELKGLPCGRRAGG